MSADKCPTTPTCAECATLREHLRDMAARAMGHAYSSSMAEAGEDLQHQELERERQDHAGTRAKVRRLEHALSVIANALSFDLRGVRDLAREALNVDD